MKKKNVLGVGVGFKQRGGETLPIISLIVSVSKKELPHRLSKSDLVPKELNGIPTDIKETKVLKALSSQSQAVAALDRTRKWRPAPGGVSIGHVDITAGTFGCIVTLEEAGSKEFFILSNNHVLANSNQGAPGDPIIQPGSHDGGASPGDVIGHLWDFVPIQFMEEVAECEISEAIAKIISSLAKFLGSKHRLSAYQENPLTNVVDCAIAKPLSVEDIDSGILEIGTPSGAEFDVPLGLEIWKSGRTTGLTFGTVDQVSFTGIVDYGVGMAIFENQIVSGPMSAGGDSGSVVLTQADNKVMGLLFAGSDEVTIINPIQAVLEGLGVEIWVP